MSLIGRRGVCMSCGHDHGNGFLSPDMERALVESKAYEQRLQDKIIELQKEVEAWREHAAAEHIWCESTNADELMQAEERFDAADEARNPYFKAALTKEENK